MDGIITLDRDRHSPLYRQLTEQLRSAILDGRLPPTTQLPSTRAVAASLHVSRAVVVTAYDELVAQGYAEGRHGSGTFVIDGLCIHPQSDTGEALPASTSSHPRWLRREAPPRQPGPDLFSSAIEFRPGKPSTALLPISAWRRMWRDVAAQLPPDDYGPPAGDPALRIALARYLGWARGLHCGPDDVIITTGAVQAVDLIARATMRPGDLVGLEEPGPVPARNILLAHGARIVPLPVDEDGLRVDLLPHGPGAPLLVYVTPSHQYPLGGRLPIARRMRLLEWAVRQDALIVEDDYDSEFRFDAAPLPALAGLDPGAPVAYIGTFSKILTPALRTGYLVAPPLLRERIERLKPLTDYHSPWPMQRALASFVSDGHLDRHVRRMRRHYAANRAALLAALAPVMGIAHPLGLDAGLHVCLELCPPLDAERIAASARRGGVIVATLTTSYVGIPDRRGLVLGYGGLTHDEIRRGAALLVEVIRREAVGCSAAQETQSPSGRW